MFKESLKLASFKKVYPLSVVSTVLLLLSAYFLNKGNATEADQITSLAIFLVSGIGFLFLYALQNKVIANEVVAEATDEEPESIKEAAASWKSYGFAASLLLISFLLIYNLILPLIGSVAGALFQVSIAGFELNLLTLVLNLMAIVWLMFGMAEINAMNVGFMDTLKYTVNFVFTNFRKVLLFIAVFLLFWFAVTLMIVFTATSDQMLFMPVKAVVIAYVLAFLNTYAVNLFIDNVTDEDFEDGEEPEEEEE